MIRADLVLENGLLMKCRIRGHAGAGPKGADIVCAAVSVLAGTIYRVLSGREGICLKGEFRERGEFFLEIQDVTAENREFLAGTGTFLMEGLKSVAAEFPDFCIVNIEEC